ncbi:MAG: hypothetical protein HY827_02235 [Actinobacteria bacterium]|nr:hypothetical protein [Actinomycetota bacterium]
MDAIWSSVVVVLAFIGTFLAIDASTKTANRDSRRTAAYDIAQTELDRLRKTGDTNLPTLLGQDNTSTPPSSPNRTVVVDGVTYSIWNRAYYVQGIGPNTTDACGVSIAGAGSTAAQYIYLKTTVTWPGSEGSTGATGGGRPKAAVLDTYFAPEGGDLQSNTGTLRIFLARIDTTPVGGRTVNLYKMPANTLVTAKTTNVNGCVLFTGLARSDYEIRIPATAEYDLFMTTNPITIPLKLPARATISRVIKIDYPVTVDPVFVTKTSSGGADVTLNAADGSSSSLVGPWIAAASEFNRASGTEYISTGYGFMPHTNSSITKKMFPQTTGYGAFAGPCDVNDPGSANRTIIPSPTSDPTWAPNTTYTGARTLRLPNFRIQLTSPTSTAGTGKIQVKLKDKPTGGTGVVNCGPRASLQNTWIKLPGVVDASGWLTAQAYALPVGEYEICARQQGTGTGWGSTTTKYLPLVNQDNNNYPNPTTVTMNVRDSGTSTACGNSSIW